MAAQTAASGAPVPAPVHPDAAHTDAGFAGAEPTTAESKPAEPKPAKPATGSRIAAQAQTAAALVWVAQAWLIARTIGDVAAGAPPADAATGGALVLALGLARGALDAAGQRIAFVEARAALSAARAQALDRLAAASPLDARRAPSGTVAGALAEQAEAATPYLARFAPARFKAAVVPPTIVAVVLPFSWAAAVILCVAAPVVPLFMALIGWKAKAASEEQLAAAGDVDGFLLDRLRGLATIRSLGAVDRTAMRLRREAESLRVRTMAVLRIAFLSSAVLELFAALGVALIAGYVGLHLLGYIDFGAWGARLTPAEGLFVLLIAPAAFEPLRELAAVWHDRAAGQAALNALDALGRGGTRLPDAPDSPAPASTAPASPAPNASPRPPARPHAQPYAPPYTPPYTPDVRPAPPSAAVQSAPPSAAVRNLTFTHAGATTPALVGRSLDVAAGERVALFSASGGGKTTLLSLIAGLARLQEGEIIVGGVALTPRTAARLRARIAWIGQRPSFFAGGLRANVALGRPSFDPAHIDAVAAAFGPPADPARRVGENGAGLSGGEAVRLALARAAVDPARDLVLADEPTAHLDRTTATQTTDALLQLAGGDGNRRRTLIVATHDPVLAARMDRTIEWRTPGREAYAT